MTTVSSSTPDENTIRLLIEQSESDDPDKQYESITKLIAILLNASSTDKEQEIMNYYHKYNGQVTLSRVLKNSTNKAVISAVSCALNHYNVPETKSQEEYVDDVAANIIESVPSKYIDGTVNLKDNPEKCLIPLTKETPVLKNLLLKSLDFIEENFLDDMADFIALYCTSTLFPLLLSKTQFANLIPTLDANIQTYIGPIYDKLKPLFPTAKLPEKLTLTSILTYPIRLYLHGVIKALKQLVVSIYKDPEDTKTPGFWKSAGIALFSLVPAGLAGLAGLAHGIIKHNSTKKQ